MADKKITALTESTSLSTDDLFHVVDSPSSSPSNKKITANNVFQKIPSWIGFADTVALLRCVARCVALRVALRCALRCVARYRSLKGQILSIFGISTFGVLETFRD